MPNKERAPQGDTWCRGDDRCDQNWCYCDVEKPKPRRELTRISDLPPEPALQIVDFTR